MAVYSVITLKILAAEIYFNSPLYFAACSPAIMYPPKQTAHSIKHRHANLAASISSSP